MSDLDADLKKYFVLLAELVDKNLRQRTCLELCDNEDVFALQAKQYM